MERWAGKTAVVTGASAGIGAAVALALADAGLAVVAGARRVELLEELEKNVKGHGRIIPVKCDVGKEDELVRLIEVAKDNGGVDVLVNNAALLFDGNITDCNGLGAALDDVEECLNVNAMAVIRATRLAVADMVQRKAPGVIIMLNRF
ncbi:Farnesol dehydrogenase [Eumeta japonica]|uniref:Farnesol dehydrogenase n=1 Tax=Eumeta variegata TaxID=151549 RepID=A0A4C2A6D7_EUMVA|nr:Farnesol dehydrogenase [Eumeta japonica]